MQIDYYSPSEFEAAVTLQSRDGMPPLVQISPKFYKGVLRQNVGYLVAKSGEAELRYALSVTADGKLQLKALNDKEDECPTTPSSNTQKSKGGGSTSGPSTTP